MKTSFWKQWILSLAFIASVAGVAIGNDYYTHGGFPATGSLASSSSMRAELDLIGAGFDKLPLFSGNGSKAVIVNSGATALTTTTGTLALAGNLATTGAFNTTFVQGATTSLTLPVVNGTLATRAGTETLTNKTVDLTSNTLTGTRAQFNTALSDDNFVTINGTETLSNKTLNSPDIGTIANGAFALAVPSATDTLVGRATTDTLTNKTITAPAISAPVLSGSATGTYTLAGTPTITAPAISNPVLSGTITGTYALGGTPTISGALDLTAGQIEFPATQSASAGANTLDDYEEGTWTPSLGGSTTYTSRTATYTKIGRKVTVSCHMQVNAIGSGSTSAITGLPFTSASGGLDTAAVYYNGAASSFVTVVAGVTTGATTVQLYSLAAAGVSLGVNAIFANATIISFTLTYIAS